MNGLRIVGVPAGGPVSLFLGLVALPAKPSISEWFTYCGGAGVGGVWPVSPGLDPDKRSQPTPSLRQVSYGSPLLNKVLPLSQWGVAVVALR